MREHLFCRTDDEAHLTDDDLAGKVLRYLRYVSMIDTSDVRVIALGRTVVLSGEVANDNEIGCLEECAASVIGVHLVENQLQVRVRH
ncbi:transporter [Rhizobium rhizosphaerae]|uniref:Transporter n=1 Tax=Xaviernesmea rhizosphaerae TaxID=1672749 RepID=A0ABX3PBK2_9HYPH|nr:BON domain-containing protein [Xaviernesmea rhizosphaerae]OQP85377.1 transporter [Xaviernesmea rhizosphaerae]